MEVFGCPIFSFCLKRNRSKLDSRSRKCVYLGLKYSVKGHVLYDLQNKQTFVSRDTIFFENIHPYNITPTSNTNNSNSTQQVYTDTYFDYLQNLNTTSPTVPPQPIIYQSNNPTPNKLSTPNTTPYHTQDLASHTPNNSSNPNTIPTTPPHNITHTPTIPSTSNFIPTTIKSRRIHWSPTNL